MHSAADIVCKYFPALTERQREQFAMLGALYGEWNAKINLISRRDIEFLYTRHVLHSLAIAKCAEFPAPCSVLDIGTGGGFPGVPLAIMFPQARFTLADSTGKKITTLASITASLGLNNVEPLQARVETLPRRFDYAVCRAAAALPVLIKWVGRKIGRQILLLKGGDLAPELQAIPHTAEVMDIAQWFAEPFFEEKKVVRVWV